MVQKSILDKFDIKTQEELFNIKEKLIEILFWTSTIFMWFALAGSLYRSIDIGLHNYNLLQIGFAFMFLIVFLFRKKLSYNFKSFILLSMVYIIGTTAIYANGLLSTGVYFLLLFTIISGIITNRKLGVFCFALSIITLIVLAYLDINKLTPNYIITNNLEQSLPVWIMSIIVFILITAIIILFWLSILSFQIKFIVKSGEKQESLNRINKLLSKEIETRKNAERLLKKQIKETNIINTEYESVNHQLEEVNAKLAKSNVQLEDAKKRAQQADKLKSSFLSNMSHEIRTPMNAIVGFATLIASNPTSKEDNNKYLAVIESSTHKLISTINDILTLAKIESGQYIMYPVLVKLSEILDQIGDYYMGEIFVQKEDRVKFEVENDFNIDTKIIVDVESLNQIIYKLIDNAIKFTPEGFVRIKTSIIDNCLLSIKVEDSGIGIPNEVKTEIFKNFRQADLGNTRKYEGSGIGLSIAKGLINLLNGTLDFNSKKNKGTSFHIAVPIINKTPSSETITKDLEIKGKGKTILVVGKITWDDQIINKLLQETNAILIYVETGFQAIDTYKDHPEIDLIIMSMFLPDMNSHETANTLKGIKADLPIFGDLASSNKPLVGLDKNIWDYIIEEPFNQNEFLIKLESYLQ